MAVNILEETSVNFTSYVPTKTQNEAKKLLKLYWTLDNWLDHIDAIEIQKIHAQVLRSQLDQLVHYYFEREERNKAKLAAMLLNTTLFVEEQGLSQTQVEVLQGQLIYFQRVRLTNDDLNQCTLTLWDNHLYTIPEMPDWKVAIVDQELT